MHSLGLGEAAFVAKARVLAVDDDPMIRGLLERVLGEEGFDVRRSLADHRAGKSREI